MNQKVLNPGQEPVRLILESHEAVELRHTLMDILEGHRLEKNEIQRSIWGGIVDKIEATLLGRKGKKS